MNARAIKEITDFIFMKDAPAKSDVIFIPGSSRAELSAHAAQLYHAGYAPYILPSGKYSSNLGRFAAENVTDVRYKGDYETEFAFCKRILLSQGVSEDAILCEDRATNTMENAVFSAEVLRANGVRVHRAILCCQAFHARRAFLSYTCHFPDTELLVLPVETQGIRSSDWYENAASYRKVMRELEKCGKYFAEIR